MAKNGFETASFLGNHPFASAFDAGKAAILGCASSFALWALFSCAWDCNHTLAVTDRAGNPGAAGIDAGRFAKNTLDCRLFNFNLARAATDLADGIFRQQTKGVFTDSLAKSAGYLFH